MQKDQFIKLNVNKSNRETMADSTESNVANVKWHCLIRNLNHLKSPKSAYVPIQILRSALT